MINLTLKPIKTDSPPVYPKIKTKIAFPKASTLALLKLLKCIIWQNKVTNVISLSLNVGVMLTLKVNKNCDKDFKCNPPFQGPISEFQQHLIEWESAEEEK